MKLLYASSILPLLLTAAVSSYETNVNTEEARVIINGLSGDLSPEDVQLVHDTIAAFSTPPSVPYPQPMLRTTGTDVVVADPDNNDDSMINGALEKIMMWSRRQPAPAPVRQGCGGWGCGGWDPTNPNHQRGRWYGFGNDYSCGPLCHDDDKFVMNAVVSSSALIVTTMPIATGTDHVNESDVCETLRRQGSSALKQATTCTITPMVSGPQFVTSLCIDGTKSGEALVFVDGITMYADQTPDTADDDDDRSSLTAEEAEIFEASVTGAYNEAYAEADLVLESFQALNMAVPPATDTTASSNDVSSTIIMGEFHQLCTNSDIQYDTTTKEDWDRMHQIFETKLCEKLRDSGLLIFQMVDTCSYRTFYNNHARTSMKKGLNPIRSSVRDE